METVDAARRWADVWRRGWEARDTDSIVALYAADARHWSAPFREPGVGQAGVRAYVLRSFDEEDDVRAWFAAPVVEGDSAVIAWWATLNENGKEITLAGMSLLRFDSEGLVVSQWDAWNQADGRIDPPSGWCASNVGIGRTASGAIWRRFACGKKRGLSTKAPGSLTVLTANLS